ncbi:MAG: DUF2807 domain-containing protein [Bacteroidales bacterium]|nr:DUF2807 domain-containing protein [Bacteroidales bacterium]
MKETKNINLGGQSFTIDNDAYESLHNYLSTLEKHFVPEDAAEIMQDIEMRIAELFAERLNSDKQVISQGDVDTIIKQLGQPSDFEDGDERSQEEKEKKEDTTERSNRKKIRRLFRNPNDMVIGGVCSGLAAFFKIDVVTVRLITAIAIIVSFFVNGFLGDLFYFLNLVLPAYIIMWIIVPKAKSVSDKLQMNGIEPTLENISNYNASAEQPVKRSGFVNFLIGCIKVIMIVFACFFGFAFIVGIIALFLCLIILFFGLTFGINELSAIPLSTTPIIIGCISFFVCIITLLTALIGLIVYFSRRQKGSKGTPGKAFWITTCIFFLLSVGGLCYCATKINTSELIPTIESMINDSSIFDEDEDDVDYHGETIATIEVLSTFSQLQASGSFDIEYTISDEPSISFSCSEKTHKNIEYEINDNTLLLKRKEARQREKVHVKLYGPALNDITLSASSKLTYNSDTCQTEPMTVKTSASGKLQGTILAEKCTFDLSSAGHCNLSGNINEMLVNATSSAEFEGIDLTCGNVVINASSASSVNISGTCNNAIYTAESAANVECMTLEAKTVTALAFSAARIEANAQDTIDMKASSAGEIIWWGNATIKNSNSNGAGKITKK